VRAKKIGKLIDTQIACAIKSRLSVWAPHKPDHWIAGEMEDCGLPKSEPDERKGSCEGAISLLSI
jgi:hypothetical protein